MLFIFSQSFFNFFNIYLIFKKIKNIIITSQQQNKMTQSKQAMQNTIKNLQAKSEYINKLEDKGSKALVLQLGSHTIKMGFANEKAPFTIRPFIAYKKPKNSSKSSIEQKSSQTFDYQYFKTQYQKLEQRLKIQGVVALDNRTLKGKPRSKQIVNIQKINQFRPDADILYGQEALWVQRDPNYIFKKPLSYGFFNVSSQQQPLSTNSFQQTLIDIQNILLHMLSTMLKIPSSQYKNFSCVLVLPDIFNRLHVKSLIQRIFKAIGFRRIYLHLESILACFGTAVSSACVIDIGHQKINIACVDEGVIVPQTLIRKNYGLKSLTKSLCKIFAERVADKQIGQIKFGEEADLNQIDKVKQISTAVRDPDQSINRIYQIDMLRKKNHISFQVSYSDSICVVSNSIFSQMWNSFENPDKQLDQFNLHSQYFDLYEDPEDYFQEYSGGGHIYEINRSNNDEIDSSFYDPWSYQPLDQLIITSLNSIKDKQQRKRYYSNILIIGGGSHLTKLSEQIIAKLNTRLGFNEQNSEKVDFASDLFLRQIAPIHASWLGGTVIPKLDSLRDLWVEKSKFMGQTLQSMEQQNEEQNKPLVENKFDSGRLDRKLFTRKEQSQQWGITYLKEKVPFIW